MITIDDSCFGGSLQHQQSQGYNDFLLAITPASEHAPDCGCSRCQPSDPDPTDEEIAQWEAENEISVN